MFSEKTLAEIVNLKPASAAVFEKYELDFCCKGKRTLAQACDQDQVKFKAVENDLEKIFKEDATFQNEPNPEKLTLQELIDHIVGKHHAYVNDALPRIDGYLLKIAEKHGSRHPELMRIRDLFKELSADFNAHMMKEERILFPRILEIEHAEKSGQISWMAGSDYISAPVGMMETEHDKAGEIMAEIRRLTSHFTPPQDACTTYKLAFHELFEFETDLHRHVHLENNNLFPRALKSLKNIRAINYN